MAHFCGGVAGTGELQTGCLLVAGGLEEEAGAEPLLMGPGLYFGVMSMSCKWVA